MNSQFLFIYFYLLHSSLTAKRFGAGRRRTGGMTGIMAEYNEISERYWAGTLRETPLRIQQRSFLDPVPHRPVGSCFGPQPMSRIPTEPAYSFGNQTREGNKKVFISKECSKSQPGNNSQGPKYMLKTTFGSGRAPAHSVESNARRAPSCFFGSDDRWSAQRREDIGRSLIKREAPRVVL